MLNYSLEGDVAVLHFDHGKANALSPAFIAAVNEGLDRAEKEAKAVVFAGKPGLFSGGFDLGVMQEGPEAAMNMVNAGGKLMLRIFTHKLPTVAACTGHAIAAGAFLLLSCDTRIGPKGNFKYAANETAIGMVLPVFAIELIKARLKATAISSVAIQAKMHSPEEAVEVGFLDRIVEPDQVLSTAIKDAQAMAELPGDAYHGNKMAMRGDFAKIIEASLPAS